MRRVLLLLCLLIPTAIVAQASEQPDWKTKVLQTIPLLGHRNWILVVDSAYPMQVASGIETIETNASLFDAVQFVLHAIDQSVQVRPHIYMDSELPFVNDEDAPGASAYRSQIGALVGRYPQESLPHERIIANVDEAGKLFHVLVLKTNMTIPYTSVFIRLDCKYWSDDDESRLRKRMGELR
jgi:hypothetical protein